jgi:signal transduction histidine kinase
MRARIIAAADDARRRLERDLHDGLQQRLLCLGLKVRLAEASIPHGHEELKCELARIEEGLWEAMEDVRQISRGLHPAVLSQCGLGPAVKALARRSPVPARLRVDIDGRLPEPVEIGAYYIICEALANAAKHAQATVVEVSIEQRGQFLDLAVRDDGVGGADGSGPGLAGLGDRIGALAGTMQLLSPPGGGTHLFVKLPTGVGPAPRPGPVPAPPW